MAIQLSTAEHYSQDRSRFNRAEPTQRVYGRLRLRFEARGVRNQTILAESEHHLPLRIVRAFQLDDGGSLVHLHNLSGGVLGGDHLELAVEARSGRDRAKSLRRAPRESIAVGRMQSQPSRNFRSESRTMVSLSISPIN